MNPYKQCLPDIRPLDLIMEFERLCHVKRCATMRVLKERSVAEHSYMVVIIALTIAEMEECVYNREMLIMKALLHDCEEGTSGDSPYTFKNHSPEIKAMFLSATEDKLNQCMGETDIAKEFINIWKKAKNCDYEGLIVKYADMLEFLVCCTVEKRMGNKMIRNEAENAVDFLEKSPLKSVINLTAKLREIVYKETTC